MTPSLRSAALAPPAAAFLALCLVAATGLDQRTPLPAAFEARFYGFFLDRYPLFAGAIVYGVALTATRAAAATGSPWRRWLGAAFGTALVLALSLYPTFGGLVLRSGFAVGGVAFLGGLPLAAAGTLGAAAAALTFGVALALASLAIGGGPEGRGWRHALVPGGVKALLRFLALWFAFGALALAHDAGFGPWPRRALDGGDLLVAAALLAALLPHAVLSARRNPVAQRDRPGAMG